LADNIALMIVDPSVILVNLIDYEDMFNNVDNYLMNRLVFA